MGLEQLHHVAYRCKDAKETAEFYTKLLDLEFTIALAENYVPSTGEWSPHIHVFFEMADGSSIAFFELPEDKEMVLDPNTPDWVQHLALRVKSMKELENFKSKLIASGVEVVGPTDHKICQSIYFFDPSGHRLELVVDTSEQVSMSDMKAKAGKVLEEWARTKKAPDVDPLHENLR